LRRRRADGIAASPHLWIPASRETRWRLAALPGGRQGTILGATSIHAERTPAMLLTLFLTCFVSLAAQRPAP